ncbi:MAG: lipopolysaccharide heptosyltransferase II [Planctomycetota bacterium]|jgi:heptosyltransferase-2
MESPTTERNMHDTAKKILIWLPSPMGDAVLCTPALRAIRQRFKDTEITFFANSTVNQILSPTRFNDAWLTQHNKSPLAAAKILGSCKFTHAVLFKNSFASALVCFLARIPSRIGYAREGRGFMLTQRLHPPKLSQIEFKPLSMIDYYLAIASWLGAETSDRKLELTVDPQQDKKLRAKLPQVAHAKGPLVILVPGGAFGPSKCWPSERFAETADWLISNYNATVVISVASDPIEQKIATEISNKSAHKLINLAQTPLTLGELKALFGIADLVISNDTGPRHIAIALQRKLVTLFGPNDPAWTDTRYENEIKITGDAPCAPCAKPVCKETEHLCMHAIAAETVCQAAKRLLEDNHHKPAALPKQKFVQISKSLFIDADYETAFSQLGLTSIDAVFAFSKGDDLTKDNLSRYRRRLKFEINTPSTTVFLKRYDSPPATVQLRNWLSARSRKSCALCDLEPANDLAEMGINTPRTIAYGQQWGHLFEKRSFIATEKIPAAESLEKTLPHYFHAPPTAKNLKVRRVFIAQLAHFVRKFHQTGYRHRDLYFSHIFYTDDGRFYLIDLARTFKPRLFTLRFRIKDIAQIHYSAPAKYFSNTDRLRFYFALTGCSRLKKEDKAFIRRVLRKARRMARHDARHNRAAPFAP